MVLAIAGAMGRATGWADSRAMDRAMSRPTAEGMSRVIFSTMFFKHVYLFMRALAKLELQLELELCVKLQL
jgi:hypothetical protein